MAQARTVNHPPQRIDLTPQDRSLKHVKLRSRQGRVHSIHHHINTTPDSSANLDIAGDPGIVMTVDDTKTVLRAHEKPSRSLHTSTSSLITGTNAPSP